MASGVRAATAARAAEALAGLHTRIAGAERAWHAALFATLLLLALTLFLGRLPLPLGLDFGYRSCARNVALVVLAGALAGVPAFRWRASSIARSFALFATVATASVVAAGERTSAVLLLWSALGVFHAIRLLARDDAGRTLVLHVLGLATVAVLARELWNDPLLVLLQEQRRFGLVSEHPNTLGFAFALLTPLFVAATVGARPRERRAACVYAACGATIVLATFSRAAWLGLAGATLVLLVGVAPPSAAAWRARLAGAVASFVAAAGAAGCLSITRIEADVQRLRIAATSLSLFREHWALGIGFGSAPLERHFPARYLEQWGESLFPFHSHNLYVDVLTGTGVAGAVAALALLWSLLRTARDGIARANGPAEHARALGNAAVLGVLLTIGLADMPLYHGRLLILVAVAWALLESDAVRRSGARAHKSSSDSAPRSA